ncbi:MAG: MAPEG family protein [Curvibacter sp.]|nr:MAPEG family protein [Curvibacter sp.]
MTAQTVLAPLFALAAWTALVLLLIPITRVRAGLRREIVADDFRYGESASVPKAVSLPNRNYMNLLELPVLFYVAGLIMVVMHCATPRMVDLAWAYVGLRVLHSLVHLSYNRVMHRLALFAASNGVLVWLWVLLGLSVFASGG